TLAAPVEIGRRAIERKNQRSLFHGAGRVAVILFREDGRLEFLLWRAFPQEIDFDIRCLRFGLLQQLGRLRSIEFEQHNRVLDLAALARFRFHLHGGIAARENFCGLECAAFFIKNVHGVCAGCRSRRIYLSGRQDSIGTAGFYRDGRMRSSTSGSHCSKSEMPWSLSSRSRSSQPWYQSTISRQSSTSSPFAARRS